MFAPCCWRLRWPTSAPRGFAWQTPQRPRKASHSGTVIPQKELPGRTPGELPAGSPQGGYPARGTPAGPLPQGDLPPGGIPRGGKLPRPPPGQARSEDDRKPEFMKRLFNTSKTVTFLYSTLIYCTSFPAAMNDLLSMASIFAFDLFGETKMPCIVTGWTYFSRIQVAAFGPLAFTAVFILGGIILAARQHNERVRGRAHIYI